MRTLERNKRTFYYCLYQGREVVRDGNGNETGEYAVRYDEPLKVRANISPATGYSQTAQFGTLDNYDKVIVLSDTTCPIDENTVLFLDKEPEFNDFGIPLYDYTVRRVAKSLNSVSIAVRKVSVS